MTVDVVVWSLLAGPTRHGAKVGAGKINGKARHPNPHIITLRVSSAQSTVRRSHITNTTNLSMFSNLSLQRRVDSWAIPYHST